MATSPIVTVCIPTYNRPVMLRSAIESAVTQSIRDIEVIVSDNASTDDTEDVVRSFSDSRLTYDRLSTNIGLHGNLTRCLHLGRGKYRVVLHDDDLMLPSNLERKARLLDENPDVGLVHSAFHFVDVEGRPTGPVQNWSRLTETTVEPGESFIRRSLNAGGLVCVASVMLRSECVAEERFDAADGPYTDDALWLRVAHRRQVGFLPDPLSGLRVHPASASSGFQTVRVSGDRHRLTRHHAASVKQAHGRFVEHADLDPTTRAEFADVVRRCDRRMRLTIAVTGNVPPRALQLAKQAVRWRPGGRLHRMLSLDGSSPTTPPPPASGGPPPAA